MRQSDTAREGENATEHNIFVLIASLSYLLLIGYYFFEQKGTKQETDFSFYWLFSLAIFNPLCGMGCTAMMQQRDPALDRWIMGLMSAMSISDALFFHGLLLYLLDQVTPAPRMRRWLWIPVLFLPAVMCAAVISNLGTGFLYTVHQGIYQAGSACWVRSLYGMLQIAAMIIVGKAYEKELGTLKLRAVWELGIILTGTLIFRSLYFRQYAEIFSGFSMALSMLVLFLTLHNPYYCIDGLTGAFNQRFFRNRCADRLARKKEFHVLTVELNQLAHINYVLGTEVGNRELIATAKMLSRCSKKNMVFRISGKRFLVLCSTLSDMETVRNQAMEFFTHPLNLGKEQINPHGVVCVIDHAYLLGSSRKIISYGEYLEKQAKRPFETCLMESTDKSLAGFDYYEQVESFLATALQEDLFEVAFQPVFDLKQNRYTTMEVLSRLNHPALGPVSPAIFIDIAERTDQIAHIALLQLRRVCRFIAEHREILHVFQNVKVNVSPVELMKDGHVEQMLNIIRDHGLPTCFFQFEITESAAIEYGTAVDEVISHFTREGIGLCLDDFGSGYANLNAVVQLPFHTIKLDRSLLFGICQDARVASLYQSLVVSLHTMGFHVLSEGVETEEERALVAGWGVDMIQGFFFSRPLAGQVLLENILLPAMQMV